jgi:hypothetical protein
MVSTTLVVWTGGVLNINSGSTIEYNAVTDQSVSTNINYYNVTFSGGGIKAPVSNLSATGTLKITGSATSMVVQILLVAQAQILQWMAAHLS